MRAIDGVFARPVENKQQYEARMERENAFLELQRELITSLIGSDAAQSIEDYYEADLPTGAFAMLQGVGIAEDLFVQDKVLGDSLLERMERYHLTLTSRNERHEYDQRSKELCTQFVHDFNPDILYTSHALHDITAPDGVKYNLTVLRKDALKSGERSGIIRRANKLLEVLAYSNKFYHYKERCDPWKQLIHKIEGVSLRAEPMRDVHFAKTGKVIEWCDPSDYADGGMVVESHDMEMRPIIRNARNQERFGHLKGQLVRYHFTGYEDMGIPYGNLVATSLSIPADDTLKLPPVE